MHSHPVAHLDEEVQRYLSGLAPPDADLPLDVAILHKEINKRLFDSRLRVGELRKELGLRNNNISSRFCRHRGMSIKEYIIHHRLELAKRLLHHNPPFRITDIAAAVGYPRPNAFSTLFRRKVGCSPSQYRLSRTNAT